MDLAGLIYKIPPILIAISIHEYAHARAAKAFGDLSAVLLGRATLNPIRHLDPFGTVCLLLFNFGWAKPVPINPYNFSHRRLGLITVSLAGPFSNLLFAAVIGLLFQFTNPLSGIMVRFLFYSMLINLGLALFNLIPLPPLDGFHVLESIFEGSRSILWLNRVGPLALISIILLDNFANTQIISTILIRPMFHLMELFGGRAIFGAVFR